jgi:ABC-type transport system involved in multi-copper enzyme maturation permease subunit
LYKKEFRKYFKAKSFQGFYSFANIVLFLNMYSIV